MTILQIGQPAPDFELPANNNTTIRLSSFKGQQNVVLFFYPKDNSLVCTKQSCQLRDNYQVLQNKDTVVLGINADKIESHEKFATQHNLPFPLLHDEKYKVAKLYGVPVRLGFLLSRVTFVIDKEGIVKQVIRSEFSANPHISKVLETLETL